MADSSAASAMPSVSLRRQIGRDLQEQRRRAFRRGFGARQLERRDQLDQRRLALQRAQARGVGRGDVDGEVIGHGRQARNAGNVIRHGVFAVAVLADIGADDAAFAAPRLEPRRDIVQTFAVKSQAVDDRAVLFQPEQARLGVARLRARRHRAHLDKSETKTEHRVRHLGVFVEARRQPDRIGKAPPPQLDAQRGRVGRGCTRGHQAQGQDAGAMRRLGWKRLQQRQRQIGQGGHGRQRSIGKGHSSGLCRYAKQMKNSAKAASHTVEIQPPSAEPTKHKRARLRHNRSRASSGCSRSATRSSCARSASFRRAAPNRARPGRKRRGCP